MAGPLPITQVVGYEDGSLVCMARQPAADGAPMQQADVTSISLSVFDMASETQTLGPTAVTVATSVFDTLQTGSPWTKDATGYNFKHTCPGTAFPNGNRSYQIQYIVTYSDGATGIIPFRKRTVDVYGQ